MESSKATLYLQRPKAVEEADNKEEKPNTAKAGHGPMRRVAEPNGKRLLERKPTEDINASAEAFINKFRQQLLLQRLESIENYEQMLKRGT